MTYQKDYDIMPPMDVRSRKMAAGKKITHKRSFEKTNLDCRKAMRHRWL